MMEDTHDILQMTPVQKDSNFLYPDTSSTGITKRNHRDQHRPSYERSDTIWNFNRSRTLPSRTKIQRVLNKSGVCNMVHTNIKFRSFQFLSDSFTTMIDLRWRYILSLFTLSYVLSWFLFGILWYIFAYAHGDVGRSFNQEDDFEPCVYNVETFTGSFLFSLETQTTIGYGFRSVSEACPHAAILVVIQSVISYLINSIMLGLIFAKLARPKKRTATLKFSRYGCIAQRDGKLCFMFRVGNIRNTSLFEAHVRAFAIKPKITDEGEYIPLHYYNLDLNYESGEDRIVLMWPLIVCHYIDKNSPLYELTGHDLKLPNTCSSPVLSKLPSVQSMHEKTTSESNPADFEILVILEGVVEQTGLVTQARTSYLPCEIKWGHRFSSQVITLRSKQDKRFRIDYDCFDTMYEVPDFSPKSAKELEEDLDSEYHYNGTKPANGTKGNHVNGTKENHVNGTKENHVNGTKENHVNGTKENHVNGTNKNHKNGTQPNHTNGTQKSTNGAVNDSQPKMKRIDEMLEKNQTVMMKTLQELQNKLNSIESNMVNNKREQKELDSNPSPLVRQSALDIGSSTNERPPASKSSLPPNDSHFPSNPTATTKTTNENQPQSKAGAKDEKCYLS